ncbi:hypothetical protein BHE74_00009948 [Ensete ventricosum]|nr:hypothetical protein BHE74_00009948 [Ensete ventricosum]
MNGTISVLVLGSSLTITGRVMTLRGAVASPMNPVKVEVMGTSLVELNGVFGGLGIVKSVLSILLLEGPGGGPQDESVWGRF